MAAYKKAHKDMVFPLGVEALDRPARCIYLIKHFLDELKYLTDCCHLASVLCLHN